MELIFMHLTNYITEHWPLLTRSNSLFLGASNKGQNLYFDVITSFSNKFRGSVVNFNGELVQVCNGNKAYTPYCISSTYHPNDFRKRNTAPSRDQQLNYPLAYVERVAGTTPVTFTVCINTSIISITQLNTKVERVAISTPLVLESVTYIQQSESYHMKRAMTVWTQTPMKSNIANNI